MIRQLNLRILKKKMARWPPSGHHWAVVLERGGGWDQLALSSSAETKTQRDSSQQVPPHHSTQLIHALENIHAALTSLLLSLFLLYHLSLQIHPLYCLQSTVIYLSFLSLSFHLVCLVF